MRTQLKNFIVSIGIHAALIGILIFENRHSDNFLNQKTRTLTLVISPAPKALIPGTSPNPRSLGKVEKPSRPQTFNLGLVRSERPRSHTWNSPAATADGPFQNNGGELLSADGKELHAFDQLALLVNGHLDYPTMLAENGVHGQASLDLYFDHEAKIDENRSHFFGDNRLVRGLLVKATRQALQDWFRGCGGLLEKNKFRDQHFHADFIITFTSTQASELLKETEGSYHLYRRSLVQTCLNPMAGGVDLTCVAFRVAGFVSTQVSSNYKIRYQALKDQLENFDDMDLKGLHETI